MTACLYLKNQVSPHNPPNSPDPKSLNPTRDLECLATSMDGMVGTGDFALPWRRLTQELPVLRGSAPES